MLIYALFCVLFAYLNHKWISKGKRIKHGLNGLLHVLVAAGFGYFSEWYHFFTSLLIARVFFDWSLNLFRGLPLGYVPLNPKSIVDKIEKKVFKDGITPKLIYILIICLLTLK